MNVSQCKNGRTFLNGSAVLRLASLPHQLAVRGRSDAVFSAECAVKVGVIAKAYVGGSLFQRGSGLDEIFGRDEPPLRNKW